MFWVQFTLCLGVGKKETSNHFAARNAALVWLDDLGDLRDRPDTALKREVIRKPPQ